MNYYSIWDSVGVPSGLPPTAQGFIFSRGSSGFYIKYPNGTVHNLDSSFADSTIFETRNDLRNVWAGSSHIATVGTLTGGAIGSGFTSIDTAYTNAVSNIAAGSYVNLSTGGKTKGIAITKGAGGVTSITQGIGILVTGDTAATVKMDTAYYGSATRSGTIKNVDWTTFNNKAPTASPTFTGTVTIPTPFTIGAVSMTSTGTQLNYLNAATGTTGTTTTNLVFSTSPTFDNAIGIGTGAAANRAINALANDSKFSRNSADANGFQLAFLKRRGTSTPANNSDVAGDILFNFLNGSGTEKTGGMIRAVIIDTTNASEDMELRFTTMKAGTLTQHVTILSTGEVGIGDISPVSALTVGNGDKFQVNTTGQMVAIDGLTTERSGAPVVVDTVARGGQTATVGATNLNSTSTNGLYRVSVYLYPTTAGTSGTVTATIKWNDGAAESAVTGTHTFGALGTPVFINGQMCQVTNSTAITWETTVTSAVGSPVYRVDVVAEKIF